MSVIIAKGRMSQQPPGRAPTCSIHSMNCQQESPAVAD